MLCLFLSSEAHLVSLWYTNIFTFSFDLILIWVCKYSVQSSCMAPLTKRKLYVSQWPVFVVLQTVKWPCVLAYLILTTVPCGHYSYYTHYTNEETEAQRG